MLHRVVRQFLYLNIQSKNMVRSIGPLEKEILDILWVLGSATARDVCNEMESRGNRKAYSTVRTLLNRLVEKGCITSKKAETGRSYIYNPKYTEREIGEKVVEKTLLSLMERFEGATVSYLAENLSDNEEEVDRIKKKLQELKEDD